MQFIEDGAKEEIQKHLGRLPNPVRLILFTAATASRVCEQEKAVLEELSSLVAGVELETHDIDAESALAAMYGISKVPALVVSGVKGSRVRFYGLPAGYEFVSLIESVKDAGAGKAEIEPDTMEKLGNLTAPIHIQVFVTLNCPYCPSAVRTAHRLALEFPLITSDMIEASEFPELTEKFGVQGVPKIIFNGKVELLGARPEADFAAAVIEASAA